jgi:hypothetical protein
MSKWQCSDFARQTTDGHFLLGDEMVLKYGLDPKAEGWQRVSDLSSWRSPYPNPWAVIHIAEQTTTRLNRYYRFPA